MNTNLKHALDYLAQGLNITVIPDGGKRPLQHSWGTLRWTPEQLHKTLTAAHNIGVILGHNGLVDLDLDWKEGAFATLVYLEPGLAAAPRFGRQGAPTGHVLVRCNDLPDKGYRKLSIKGLDKEKATVIELRGSTGHQTVFPGSALNGVPVVWHDIDLTAPLPVFTYGRLLALIHHTAAILALSKLLTPGGINDTLMRLTGGMLKSWRMPRALVEAHCTHLATTFGGPDAARHAAGIARMVESACARLESGESIEGFGKLLENAPPHWQLLLDSAAEWFDIPKQPKHHQWDSPPDHADPPQPMTFLPWHIADARRDGKTVPATPQEIHTLWERHNIPKESGPTHAMLVGAIGDYYLSFDGYHKLGNPKELAMVQRNLSFYPPEIVALKRKKEVPLKTLRSLYAREIDKIVLDYDATADRIEGRTLIKPNHGRDLSLRPVYSARVHEWLEALSPNYADTVRAWFAQATRVEDRAGNQALFLCGTAGAGKSLATLSLARIYGPKKPVCNFSELLDGFNDAYLNGPVVSIDEAMDKKDFSVFKKITNETTRPVNGKYEKKVTLQGPVKILITANSIEDAISHIGHGNDNEKALKRRLTYIQIEDSERLQAAKRGMGLTDGPRNEELYKEIAEHYLWLGTQDWGSVRLDNFDQISASLKRGKTNAQALIAFITDQLQDNPTELKTWLTYHLHKQRFGIRSNKAVQTLRNAFNPEIRDRKTLHYALKDLNAIEYAVNGSRQSWIQEQTVKQYLELLGIDNAEKTLEDLKNLTQTDE